MFDVCFSSDLLIGAIGGFWAGMFLIVGLIFLASFFHKKKGKRSKN